MLQICEYTDEYGFLAWALNQYLGSLLYPLWKVADDAVQHIFKV